MIDEKKFNVFCEKIKEGKNKVVIDLGEKRGQFTDSDIAGVWRGKNILEKF